MVAPARGSGFLRRRAGRLVHGGQRGRLSRFPKLRLARRARIQSLNRAPAPDAPHGPRCRVNLEEASPKEEMTVPGVSFLAARGNVRLQDRTLCGDVLLL